MMLSVLPNEVLTLTAVVPLASRAAAVISCPWMVSLPMPSGEVMVKLPVLISDWSVFGAGSTSSPEPSGRPFSLTTVSPPSAWGVRPPICGVESPIVMVSVVCARSPSPSLMV